MKGEIEQLCDRVLAAHTPGEIATALGVDPTPKSASGAMHYFEGAFETGPFARIDLRVNQSTGLMFLVLEARADVETKLGEIDMHRYGAAPLTIDVNPRIPPEGTTAYTYPANGTKVTFQYTTTSQRLRLVSFDWPPRL